MDQMVKSRQEAVGGEACLIAAEQIQRKLMALARKIGRTNDPFVGPNNLLPVDVFLDEMDKRKSAPRIIFKPKQLRDKVWTKNVTAFVYAGIEQAFVKAGKLSGGNRSGHVRKLRALRAWTVRQEARPERVIPLLFVQKTALLFSKGILEERRPDRIGTIIRIGDNAPTLRSDLARLKKWIDEDLSDSFFRKKGRSTDYQKIVFAAEIANLWYRITGKPICKGPDTNFMQFVAACWKSGFVGMEVNTSFKCAVQDHIAEYKEPYSCCQCYGCKESGKSERKRYYGTLI